MGRSVDYPPNAWVTYAKAPTDEDWERCDCCGDRKDDDCECDQDEVSFSTIYGETDWDWLKDDLRDRAKALMPSMWSNTKWLGRENQVLMSNDHAHFGFSEYCGLMSIWLVVRDDAERPGLAEEWCQKVWPKFQEEFGEFQKVGSMSNGEGVFKRIAA